MRFKSEPVIKICEDYKRGHPFLAKEYAFATKDLFLSSIRVDDKSIALGRFATHLDPKELDRIDQKGSQGIASATIAVFIPKFSCRIKFDKNIVLDSSSGWWD